jgi:hypothetical protein
VASGLIGHTGFVGSNLGAAFAFDEHYNSANFRTMAGRSFDLLVCAGVSAVKWKANKEPERDKGEIASLIGVLSSVRAREFVLISTIDVYPEPADGGDERTPIDLERNTPYGRHRRELEIWASAHFPVCRTVRLPALFGPGLRKNALFDLLHGHDVWKINPAALFQWYPVMRLWSDICVARAHDLALVNLFTEPVRMSRIIDRFFADTLVGAETTPAPAYRLRTRYDSLFAGSGGYILSANECLEKIGEFIASERG